MSSISHIIELTILQHHLLGVVTYLSELRVVFSYTSPHIGYLNKLMVKS